MNAPIKLSLKIPKPIPEFFHTEFFHGRRGRHSRLLPTPEEVEHVDIEGQHCRASMREYTTQEAKEWIESMIRTSGRWDNHLSIIRIDCPHTTAELLELGRLPQPEGVRECRKMVRAPVIYDEIGFFLWEKLAEMERGPNFRMQDEEREAEYAREVRMRMTLANLDERFLFETPKYASSAAGEKARDRQDSESISPTEVRVPPREEWRQRSQCRSSHSSQECHFCGHDSICASTEVFDDTRRESVIATRSRVGSCKSHESCEQSQVPAPTTTKVQPTSPDKHRRRSSQASSFLWQREYASSLGSSRALHRNGSFTDRVVHVVENLSKNVGTTLGHSLGHGYGYAGQRSRRGSVLTL
ncbi:hypothetical protein VM1G_05004 [Cytospora mali]|uniref:Uncharacterized protein n=1 Tax=Cytospora mali TaxID=578113 RepID=A0A194VYI0_CYTMA|nr:hypothetical protein VM1G_05004 [Valsa mali]